MDWLWLKNAFSDNSALCTCRDFRHNEIARECGGRKGFGLDSRFSIA